jgi:hypothetical protein
MKNKNPRRSSNIGKLAISTAGDKKLMRLAFNLYNNSNCSHYFIDPY